ncbi:hotdog fold domain-containing protein [Williamsia maris]|uniref:Acyl-coenzyme A thioesterase PaaI, contains HGG motif n=1 Tax=Williamsia maris TaxID=72806 RepID=A0ABT1HHW8_9NOCA|nr:hotdog fold domain-containing protein [Williamsia maris]MCP2177617.1 Acyl-coenzyme A thioesterase PaaI, contains HGG motif [Williamsia maris]
MTDEITTLPTARTESVTPTYALWRRLPQNAVGAALFSIGMVARVPYFGTILPSVKELRPGYCEVTAPKWFGVHNHIGTFHAIAACNLAETAMGMLMEASTPTTLRWLPKAMTSQYLAKATTGLRAVATLPDPIDAAAIGDGAEIVVDIAITDKAGLEVVHCAITCWVTPK